MEKEPEIQSVPMTQDEIRAEHQKLAIAAGEIGYIIKIKEAESIEIYKRMQFLNNEMAKLLQGEQA